MAVCKSPPRQAHPQRDNPSLNFPFAGMGRLLGACQQGHQPLLCENTPTSLYPELGVEQQSAALYCVSSSSCTLCGGASSSPLLRFRREQDAPVLDTRVVLPGGLVLSASGAQVLLHPGVQSGDCDLPDGALPHPLTPSPFEA